MLTVCLITLGDPATLTGGYRYHRRMAELAGRNDARVGFVSLPLRLPVLYGYRALRAARADVVLVDSIAAAFLAPWILLRRPRRSPQSRPRSTVPPRPAERPRRRPRSATLASSAHIRRAMFILGELHNLLPGTPSGAAAEP